MERTTTNATSRASLDSGGSFDPESRAARFFAAIESANAHRVGRGACARYRDTWRYWRNRGLAPLEKSLEQIYVAPDIPIVFIVGGPRTGSTVLHQLLCEYLEVGYTNNKMAGFWSVPVIAAMLYGRAGGGHGIELSSDHGRSVGPNAPHEFSWFWHEYFDFRDHDDLSTDELARVDAVSFRRALQGLAGWFGRPTIVKTPKFTAFQIDWLARHLPASRFLWITRQRDHNVASILEARVREQGDPSVWWAARPRDYRRYRHASPQAQVEHQVDAIAAAVGNSLARLPERRRLELRYEDLVSDPMAALQAAARLCEASVVNRAELSAVRLRPSIRTRSARRQL
ncbi:MAG: sulfotransferase [Myxococcales bacterium FL481]|nr:MAG: sulfotransferase [Myxococcales bacterium FL481]